MTRRRPLIPLATLAETLWPYPLRHVALPVPLPGICDEPCICVAVNVEWAGYLVGAMHVLEQPFVWAGSETDKERGVQQIMELIDNMTCGCTGSCNCVVDVQIANSLAALINLQLQIIDDGTVPSWAPNAPDTSFSEDSGDQTQEEIDQRVSALCFACYQMVGAIIGGIADRVGLADTWNEVIATIIGLFDPPVGIVVEIVTQVAIELISDLIEDEEAVKKVVCCMFEHLVGRSIEPETFYTSLDDCGFAPLTNEWQLQQILRTHVTLEENYRAFVRYLDRANRVVPDDIPADACSCEDCWTEDGNCDDKQCIETLEGTYNCTGFDQTWEDQNGSQQMAIETTIRFPDAYVLRAGIVTDSFLGVTGKQLQIFVNGDSGTGELVETIDFEENIPTFREVTIARTVDQITWRVTADPHPTGNIRCFQQTICTREPTFPLGICEE